MGSSDVAAIQSYVPDSLLPQALQYEMERVASIQLPDLSPKNQLGLSIHQSLASAASLPRFGDRNGHGNIRIRLVRGA